MTTGLVGAFANTFGALLRGFTAAADAPLSECALQNLKCVQLPIVGPELLAHLVFVHADGERHDLRALLHHTLGQSF